MEREQAVLTPPTIVEEDDDQVTMLTHTCTVKDHNGTLCVPIPRPSPLPHSPFSSLPLPNLLPPHPLPLLSLPTCPQVTEDLEVDPEENSSHYMAILIESLSILGKVQDALNVRIASLGDG